LGITMRNLNIIPDLPSDEEYKGHLLGNDIWYNSVND
jgi:hypothetical protein